MKNIAGKNQSTGSLMGLHYEDFAVFGQLCAKIILLVPPTYSLL